MTALSDAATAGRTPAMSATDPNHTRATLELPKLHTGRATEPATGRLRPPADRKQDLPAYREQDLAHRSDPRERLTDGIVELRKRRQSAGHRAAAPADPESRLAAMARRASQRAGHLLA